MMARLRSEIAYADMNDGSWAVVLQAPDHDFVVQREFNLTAGGTAVTVVLTVRIVTLETK